MQNTLTITSKRNIYQDIILRSLCRMDKGRMDITLPGGERITIGDGQGPVAASISIRDTAFFKRCVLYGDVGFGEAYVDGLWDTDDISQVISWFLLNVDKAPGVSGNGTQDLLLNLLKGWNKLMHFKRANSMEGSRKNISRQ